MRIVACHKHHAPSFLQERKTNLQQLTLRPVVQLRGIIRRLVLFETSARVEDEIGQPTKLVVRHFEHAPDLSPISDVCLYRHRTGTECPSFGRHSFSPLTFGMEINRNVTSPLRKDHGQGRTDPT